MRRRGWLTGAILIGISLFIIWMQWMTPLFGDDFSYSVSFVTKEPMQSFSDVIASQVLHYTTTNGRTVVHILAQTLLWLGKPGIDIVYGILFGTFCLLISVYWTGDIRKTEPWHLAVIFLVLWFGTPSFGGSYLWKMGAANYLLSPQIILLFFLPYRFSMEKRTARKHGAVCAAAMLFFGVIAGWTNENTSLALIAMIGTVLLLRIVFRYEIRSWMVTGLIGSSMGALLLFLSPAQAQRLASAGGMGGPSDWVVRFKHITLATGRYLWFLILLGLILCICLYKKWRAGRLTKPERVFPGAVFFIGTGISVYSMVGSPQFPVWVWSSIIGFALISVGALFYAWVGEGYRMPPGRQGILLVLVAVLVSVSYCSVYPELDRIQETFVEREEYIEAGKAAGQMDFSVPGIQTDCTYSSYSLFRELEPNREQWPNTAIANYYGIDSIACIE